MLSQKEKSFPTIFLVDGFLLGGYEAIVVSVPYNQDNYQNSWLMVFVWWSELVYCPKNA